MSDEERLPPRPAWRADFPVERAEAQHVNRREFAKYLVLVSGGFAAGSGVIAVKDDLVAKPELPEGGTRLCGVDELPVGASLPFVVPGTNVPAFVVRLDEVTFRAYETKCTHLSCAVFYAPESGRIECPCHNGAFDARSGAVLQGPPPRGLRRFTVEVRGGDLVLTGEERS
ncbi:MAG TPA: Rieske (2Fe-2S) protein [Thermoanaerobaculia bacterium]|nr:Rieske (2Fe-2S) protein [Thermoanaerobaculia bacterium]